MTLLKYGTAYDKSCLRGSRPGQIYVQISMRRWMVAFKLSITTDCGIVLSNLDLPVVTIGHLVCFVAMRLYNHEQIDGSFICLSCTACPLQKDIK